MKWSAASPAASAPKRQIVVLNDEAHHCAGNLFMVFGEPDVEIRHTDEGHVEVEIRGLDVYDPTTGEVRSSSTDDIAYWFVDTNYNEESFFVREAYFTGAGDPYESCARLSDPTSTKQPGRRCIARRAGRSAARRRARSPSR